MIAISDLISRCKAETGNIQYLGEVLMSREEMCSVAPKILNRSLTTIPKDDQDFVATILAVNCMCYKYDDLGFWHHFEKLCGRSLEQNDKYYWGTVFENTLERKGFIEKRRSGPFRYVGLLLEQAGLPFYYIPHFIRIIKDLAQTPGWQPVIAGPNRLITDYVSTLYIPRYLKDFLLDISGVNFTRQVVKLVHLYSEGVLSQSDILQLPGFRPEFWQQVFALLQEPRKKSFKLVANPYILLNVHDYRLGLALPSSDYTIDGLHDCPQQFPVTWFASLDHLLDMYSGRIKGLSQIWAIPGLNIIEPVLFDSAGRIVSRLVVKPGKYYLVSTEGSGSDWELLGKVKLGNADSHINVFKITLSDTDDLGAIRVMRLPDVEVSAGHLIPWDTGAIRVIVSKDANVVRVTNPEQINEGHIGLFLDAGNGVTRVKHSSKLSRVLKDIALPAEVKVWCEALGRTRNLPGDNISELHIKLFPNLEIEFEDRWYSYFETPSISVRGKGIEVQLYDADAVGQKQFKIRQGIKQVTGMIRAGNIKTGFSFMVKRYGLLINETEVRSHLVAEDLSKETFSIAGEPGASISLGFTDSHIEWIGSTNKSGNVSVEAECLVRLASAAKLPVKELQAFFNDKAHPLGTKLVDVSRLDKFQGFEIALCSVEKIINLCYELREGDSTAASLAEIPRISPALDNWLYINFLCAWVFDSVSVMVAGEVVRWEEMLCSEYIKAVALWANSSGDIRPAKTDLLPPPGRWRDNYFKRAKWTSEEHRRVAYIEWREELLSAKTRRCKSAIARLDGGNDLCSAWEFYLRSEFGMATQRLRLVGESNSIIHDLKGILASLIYLRTARFTAAYKVSEVSKTGDFYGTFTALHMFAGILCGQQGELPQPPMDEVSMLPLTKEDMELFAGLDLLKNESQRDWLLIVLSLYVSLKKGLPSPCSENIIISTLRNIPASPERQNVIEQVREWRRLLNE